MNDPDPTGDQALTAKPDAARKPLNVLCLVMDQLRWDFLGCYGNPVVRTPNLDRLASQGVVLDRAYVANPLCMPARATLFTGLMPRDHGVRTNGIPLDPRMPTVTEALRRSGYHTHAVGKLHLSNYSVHLQSGAKPSPAEWPECRDPWMRGEIEKLPSPYYGLESADFVGGHATGVAGEYLNWIRREHPDMLPRVRGEELLEDWTEACGEPAFKSALPEELHYNRYIAERTADFLAARKADGRPFFCWCSFPDPHHPYAATRPYCDWYEPGAMPPPAMREGELGDLAPHFRVMAEEGAESRWGTLSGRRQPTRKSAAEIGHIRAMTAAMVSSVDAAIGLVMDALEKQGLAADTAVCFLTDHGDMLGDHGLMNKGPFHFEGLLRMPMIWSCPGRFARGIRSAGLASQLDFAPTVLDLCGVPVPEGPAAPQPEARCQRPAWPGRSLAPVLLGQAKKVRDWVIVENDEDYLGCNLRTFITNRYKITVYEGREDWGELFDLREDPCELRNLWAAPEARSIKDALLVKFLQCYLREESGLPRRISHA